MKAVMARLKQCTEKCKIKITIKGILRLVQQGRKACHLEKTLTRILMKLNSQTMKLCAK